MTSTDPMKKCDCCGWDDSGFQHEPQCSSLTPSPAGWVQRFYELYMKGRKEKAPQSYIDYYQARNFISNELADRDAALVEKVRGMRELHTHNSIPSYTADADEGCITCIRNTALDAVISLITNRS